MHLSAEHEPVFIPCTVMLSALTFNSLFIWIVTLNVIKYDCSNINSVFGFGCEVCFFTKTKSGDN